jgi:hypothetical protein
MTQKLLKSWTPGITYEFELRIDDQDYSNDLVSITIRTSANTPYQNISLDLYLDASDILSEEIYGQTPIKLSVKLLGEQRWPQQTVDFDLLFLNTSTDFSMQRTHEDNDQKERAPLRIETISRQSYQTMTTQVNGLYFGKKPEDIVNDVLSKTTANIDYDVNGKSTLNIDQFIIPPSTVYRTIHYLNDTYGIFNGVLGFHCSYDNRVKVQNLSKKIVDSQALTVHQLATNTDQSKIFEDTDPSKFYTKVPIKAFNRGNSIFSVLSPTNRYIVKPRNQLYKTININTEEQALKYGLISENVSGTAEIFYDKEAIKTDKRITYHTNQTGYDLDNTFINSTLTESLQDMTQLQIEVQHDLPILNLMAVGEGVNFLTEITSYGALSGFYVLKASEIGWIRSKVWESWANLHLIRTNISTT